MTAASAVGGESVRWLADDLLDQVGQSWRLVGSRCEQCDWPSFPPVAVCARCLSTNQLRVPFGPVGRIHSVTTVAMAPPGFAAPYRLAWVDFDEGVRVFGQVVMSENGVGVGDPVEVTAAVVRHDADGTEVWGHSFRGVASPS